MMKVMLVYDKENETEYSNVLKQAVLQRLLEKNMRTELFEVNSSNVKSCMGCMECWVKTPGECVIDDLLNQMNRFLVNSDLVIYISAIIFGQYSAVMKNVMDRFIPNVLPFFVKKDGITVHPGRYSKYPRQILIGYGDDLTEDEVDTFITLTSGKYNKSYDRVFVAVTDKDNEEIVNHIL